MIIQLHQKHPENCFTMSKPTEKYFFFAELRLKLSFKKQILKYVQEIDQGI